MMEPELKITKLDAARRQLKTAVRLYFNDEDAVSIHTLACASHEILATLKSKKCDYPMIMSDHLINEPYKKEFRQIISAPKNFFKHADKDANATMDFNPKINEYFLLDACEAYELLTGEKEPYFTIFRAWFVSQHPEIMNLPHHCEVRRRFGDNKLQFFKSMLEASTGLQ